ncbi:MAG: SurA N-terminal domain-containing protein [Patescibacteria group bacterium]
MSEQEKTTTEPIATITASAKQTTSQTWKLYAGAAAIVLIILAGVVALKVSQGRLDVPVVANMLSVFQSQSTVAVVNDVKIKQATLDVSVKQIEQSVGIQGIDVTDPDVQANIRTQAVTMLVNTELLRQAATERGIEVTDEDVASRITTLEDEVGGADVLATRMDELGIEEATLRSDIKNELLIQALLDQKFTESDITISEEDIEEVYENASLTSEALPPLEDVREQIRAQLQAEKEQQIIDEYLETLKNEATVKIMI